MFENSKDFELPIQCLDVYSFRIVRRLFNRKAPQYESVTDNSVRANSLFQEMLMFFFDFDIVFKNSVSL